MQYSEWAVVVGGCAYSWAIVLVLCLALALSAGQSRAVTVSSSSWVIKFGGGVPGSLVDMTIFWALTDCGSFAFISGAFVACWFGVVMSLPPLFVVPREWCCFVVLPIDLLFLLLFSQICSPDV